VPVKQNVEATAGSGSTFAEARGAHGRRGVAWQPPADADPGPGGAYGCDLQVAEAEAN